MPDALEAAVRSRRHSGRPIGAVLVTMPDNPTGTAGQPGCRPRAVRGRRAERTDHHQRRDLPRSRARPEPPFLSPAQVAPDRTVRDHLAEQEPLSGGWRIGVARMPDGAAGMALREQAAGRRQRDLVSPGRARCRRRRRWRWTSQPSWSTRELQPGAARGGVPGGRKAVRGSRPSTSHAPQAAFYLYPDFAPWRDQLRGQVRRRNRHGPGRASARQVRGWHAAGQRIRRERVLPAAAAGHRPAVRRHRRAARAGADRSRSAATAAGSALP